MEQNDRCGTGVDGSERSGTVHTRSISSVKGGFADMKTKMKMIRRMLILTGLILMLSLTACGEGVPQLAESNSTEVELGYFKVTVFDYFKPATGSESEETTRYFDGGKGETALVIHFDKTNRSSREARLDFLCENMASAFKTTPKRIKREKLSENRYYLSWTSRVNGEELPCGAYVFYEELYELTLYEVDALFTAEELRSELTQMGEKAVYTGAHFVKKDNYTLATPNFRVKIESKYDSPQLQEATEDSSGLMLVNKETIAVYYKEADTYTRGDAYFKLTYLPDQTKTIEELAREKAENKEESSKSNRVLEETTLGKIWPELKDDHLKSEKAYKIVATIDGNPYTVEMYYFAVDGKNYAAGLIYSSDDEATRKDMMDQFYQLEFVPTEM